VAAAWASWILAFSGKLCQVLIVDCGPFPLPQQPEWDFGSKWRGSLFAAGLLSKPVPFLELFISRPLAFDWPLVVS